MSKGDHVDEQGAERAQTSHDMVIDWAKVVVAVLGVAATLVTAALSWSSYVKQQEDAQVFVVTRELIAVIRDLNSEDDKLVQGAAFHLRAFKAEAIPYLVGHLNFDYEVFVRDALVDSLKRISTLGTKEETEVVDTLISAADRALTQQLRVGAEPDLSLLTRFAVSLADLCIAENLSKKSVDKLREQLEQYRTELASAYAIADDPKEDLEDLLGILEEEADRITQELAARQD